MAYVTVEDEAASIELLCFSRTIERCGSYMQVNSPVLVQGKLSLRDEKPPQIMCDGVYPLKEGLPPRRENHRRTPPFICGSPAWTARRSSISSW